MATSFTRFGTLMAGLGAFTAGVLTTAVAGSLITKGDLIFDTASNTVPAIVVNETDVQHFSTTQVDSVVTFSGGVIKAGGGLTTFSSDGIGRFPTVEADTVSGATIRDTAGTITLSAGNGRATTFEADTLSGATIRDTAGTFLLSAGNGRATTFEADTLSGATIRSTDGTATITNGLVEATTMSGGTIRAASLTGSALDINKMGAGSGKLKVHGSDGAYICLRDSDDAGWVQISGNNGAIIVNAGDTNTCP